MLAGSVLQTALMTQAIRQVLVISWPVSDRLLVVGSRLALYVRKAILCVACDFSVFSERLLVITDVRNITEHFLMTVSSHTVCRCATD
jgi:hypothetical protein